MSRKSEAKGMDLDGLLATIYGPQKLDDHTANDALAAIFGLQQQNDKLGLVEQGRQDAKDLRQQKIDELRQLDYSDKQNAEITRTTPGTRGKDRYPVGEADFKSKYHLDENGINWIPNGGSPVAPAVGASPSTVGDTASLASLLLGGEGSPPISPAPVPQSQAPGLKPISVFDIPRDGYRPDTLDMVQNQHYQDRSTASHSALLNAILGDDKGPDTRGAFVHSDGYYNQGAQAGGGGASLADMKALLGLEKDKQDLVTGKYKQDAANPANITKAGQNQFAFGTINTEGQDPAVTGLQVEQYQKSQGWKDDQLSEKMLPEILAASQDVLNTIEKHGVPTGGGKGGPEIRDEYERQVSRLKLLLTKYYNRDNIRGKFQSDLVDDAMGNPAGWNERLHLSSESTKSDILALQNSLLEFAPNTYPAFVNFDYGKLGSKITDPSLKRRVETYGSTGGQPGRQVTMTYIDPQGKKHEKMGTAAEAKEWEADARTNPKYKGGKFYVAGMSMNMLNDIFESFFGDKQSNPLNEGN